MPKKIYVADDEINICTLIQGYLVNGGYEVETFEDGESLLERFHEKQPDMIILDIMMPGMDGLNVCTAIRRESNVPIIIVSAKDSPIDRVAGITLGSDDYLVKPFLPIELTARVNALFRRMEMLTGKIESTQIIPFGNMELNLQMRKVSINGREFIVTPNELEFLAYMLEHSYRAVSRDELLKEVWKFSDYEADTRATDDMVKRLRKKMKEIKCNVLIETVWGYGFRLAVIQESEG